MDNVNDILNDIKNKVADADLVLVGIGEQCALPTRKMEDMDVFSFALKSGQEDIYPYLQQIFIRENEREYLEFYNRLAELIADKNYYVLTTNVDDVIYRSNLRNDRIVAPCGSIQTFVCKDCKGDIEKVGEEEISNNKEKLIEQKLDEIQVKKCPVCGKIMTPNIVSCEYYDEKGYLDKWSRYTKWLQGTVNRKLCILELGVGLNYPTVIRWPNERIATYNNKAYMYRVHSTLSQLSEGIGERAMSVSQNPMTII